MSLLSIGSMIITDLRRETLKKMSAVVSISKIETLIHENENTVIHKKDFLLCGSCFWCAHVWQKTELSYFVLHVVIMKCN